MRRWHLLVLQYPLAANFSYISVFHIVNVIVFTMIIP